jgi:hypothetical protein
VAFLTSTAPQDSDVTNFERTDLNGQQIREATLGNSDKGDKDEQASFPSHQGVKKRCRLSVREIEAMIADLRSQDLLTEYNKALSTVIKEFMSVS